MRSSLMSFESYSHYRTPLQLVFTNILSPFRKPPLREIHIFVTLIDDYSDFSLIMFSSSNGDAAIAEKNMISEMETIYNQI